MQLGCIGQVAVMRDRKAAEGEISVERLHIAECCFAGCRVAIVPHRCGPPQTCHYLGVGKYVPHQPLALMGMEDACIIQRDDAGGFLSAVLQSV